MRASTAVYILGFAGVACATSENIDPSALRGPVTGPGFDGGSSAGASGFGGDVGTGGYVASGGSVGSGGVPPMGGAVATGGVVVGSGGVGPGGAKGTGGAATGGAPPGSGGSVGGSAGAMGTGGSCQSNEKVCGGMCVSFGPANGCSAPGCTACSQQPPAHGVLACNAQGQCDFNCDSGYNKVGSNCVSATGGGDGGGGLSCGGQVCTNSCPLSTQCCKSGGGCGCNIPILGCQ